MELEKKNILSEVTQTQKDEYNMRSLKVDASCKAKDKEPIIHHPRETK